MPYVVQYQGLTWGAGDTPADALRDARQWLTQDGPDERIEQRLTGAVILDAAPRRVDDVTVYVIPAPVGAGGA